MCSRWDRCPMVDISHDSVWPTIFIETSVALLYFVRDILLLQPPSLPKQSTLKILVSNGKMLSGPKQSLYIQSTTIWKHQKCSVLLKENKYLEKIDSRFDFLSLLAAIYKNTKHSAAQCPKSIASFNPKRRRWWHQFWRVLFPFSNALVKNPRVSPPS